MMSAPPVRSDRSLNIALYADIYRAGTSGGVDAYFADLVDALVTHQPDHRYTILAPYPNLCPDIIERFAGKAVRVLCLNKQPYWERFAQRVSSRLGFSLARRRNEARAIDRLGFDLVSFPRNVVFVQHLRTPVALHLFDLQHEYYPEFFSPEKVAERQRQYGASIDRADVIIVASNYTWQTVLEKASAQPKRIVVVYPGLADGWQRATADSVAAVRARYDLPNAFFFYPANPWPHKNHARLFAALRVLREREGIMIPMVLTGRLLHEPATHLQSMALAAGVEDQIIDLGFIAQEDLAALYSAARGLVVPSLFEGFGLPLLEAMACQCPVACAQGTCLPEVAASAALLFDPLKVTAIAEAMRRLWNDADLRVDLVARGSERVKHFTWEDSTAQIIAAYQRVVLSGH